MVKIEKHKENLNLFYLYNGTCINSELKFSNQANKIDNDRKKMNILVTRNDANIKIKEIVFKDIICPECKENILIEIKNFKISLYNCKNNHSIKDILLTQFGETQEIDLNKIICELCKKNNKMNTHNNDFYICNTCNKSICPLCKSVHDQEHSIIKYDDKNYICKKHNDPFTKYCKKCVEEWSKRKNQCPNRCDNPNYRKSIEKANILSKLKVKC